LSFFEGKLDLCRLRGLVHNLCLSPIFARRVGKGMAFDQYKYGVYGCNESEGKYIAIYGRSPFPFAVGCLIVIPVRDSGAIP
jgi:hypothetical protein